MKIWEADILDEEVSGKPGTVERVQKDSIDVATGKGLLQIRSLQLEGKKRMAVRDFLLGYEIKPGQCLGEEGL